MLRPIIEGMGRILAYFYSIVPSYGVAIILLTVIVRVLMIPLAIKQAHSMQANRGNQEKMRKLAPEVKKIKEKYKNDRARQYEEQKKLYDKHDVNMLGGLSGCVPMLLQAPIFMAMYAVLQGCDKLLGGTCELGNNIPAGSALHEAILEGRDTFLGLNLNFSPAQVWSEQAFVNVLPYALLVVVMGVTMWFQTKQMMKMQPAAADPQMAQTQKIMQFMPLMVVFFSINFPAGLTVYWTSSNVWTIGQQYILLKKVGGPAPPPEKKKAGPGDGKRGDRADAGRGGGKDVTKGSPKQATGSSKKDTGPKAKDEKGMPPSKGKPTPKRPPKGAPTPPNKRSRRAASGARVGTKAKGSTGGRGKDSAARKPNKGRG